MLSLRFSVQDVLKSYRILIFRILFNPASRLSAAVIRIIKTFFGPGTGILSAH